MIKEMHSTVQMAMLMTSRAHVMELLEVISVAGRDMPRKAPLPRLRNQPLRAR